jgi:hypothetical protein
MRVPRRGHHIFDWQEFFALDARRIMSRLCAVSAIFTAAASFDTQKTAPLHFFTTPMLKVNSTAL